MGGIQLSGETEVVLGRNEWEPSPFPWDGHPCTTGGESGIGATKLSLLLSLLLFPTLGGAFRCLIGIPRL
jgi:hypothetical protein